MITTAGTQQCDGSVSKPPVREAEKWASLARRGDEAVMVWMSTMSEGQAAVTSPYPHFIAKIVFKNWEGEFTEERIQEAIMTGFPRLDKPRVIKKPPHLCTFHDYTLLLNRTGKLRFKPTPHHEELAWDTVALVILGDDEGDVVIGAWTGEFDEQKIETMTVAAGL